MKLSSKRTVGPSAEGRAPTRLLPLRIGPECLSPPETRARIPAPLVDQRVERLGRIGLLLRDLAPLEHVTCRYGDVVELQPQFVIPTRPAAEGGKRTPE